jgi:hypothetical protein
VPGEREGVSAMTDLLEAATRTWNDRDRAAYRD